ncbi:MAG: hypothetical protein ACOYNP_17625, partial [Gemmataceae bacterium]
MIFPWLLRFQQVEAVGVLDGCGQNGTLIHRKTNWRDRCSKGCNIEVHSDRDVVYRYIPIFNEAVNGHWMCDEGRSSYQDLMDTS